MSSPLFDSSPARERPISYYVQDWSSPNVDPQQLQAFGSSPIPEGARKKPELISSPSSEEAQRNIDEKLHMILPPPIIDDEKKSKVTILHSMVDLANEQPQVALPCLKAAGFNEVASYFENFRPVWNAEMAPDVGVFHL